MHKTIKVKYIGSYFIDIVGEELTTADLAKRLEVSSNTVRAKLHENGAIKKGVVTDEDLGHYLPDKATIHKQKAALELSSRAWR